MSVKPFKVSVLKLTAASAAAPAADRMRPTKKHAKVLLDSDVFRLWLTGRPATAKDNQNTI